jgi:hypothetical protein
VTDSDRYEVLVIGSGEAGKYMAWTMAKTGHRTAVIERKLVGGSCPNVACLPSKNIIHSAKVASLARRGIDGAMDECSREGDATIRLVFCDGRHDLRQRRRRRDGAILPKSCCLNAEVPGNMVNSDAELCWGILIQIENLRS